MSRIGDKADIETVLRRIGETGALPEPYATDPGRLFLDIHEQWVENGGTVAGKRRNSVRNLMDMLNAAGASVPSLRSKLNGETRLKDVEAAALIGTYFSNWRFEAAEGCIGGYVPFESDQLNDLVSIIQQPLFGDHAAVLLPRVEKVRRGNLKVAEAEPDPSARFLAGQDFILENFEASKAAITISRIGSVKGPTTASAIRAFCEIIDDHWKVDKRDQLDRVLLWIVDPGDRDIKNDESLAAFANAEQLATFFRAVRLLRDPDAEARWAWLSEHAAVMIGSQEAIVTDRLYASQTQELRMAAKNADVIPRGIKYSHFLLDTPPPAWLRSIQFAQLYGDDLEDLEHSSFLLWLDETEAVWRYFAYAELNDPIITKDGKEAFIKALEIESPGPVFDRAASIVYAAACFRLDSLKTGLKDEECLRSAIILRHLDFAVFRLSEFLNAEKLSKSPP